MNFQGIKASDILTVLDKEAVNYNFPMPNNICNYNVGMHLTVFRSDREWLIVFEMLNYTQNHEFLNEICAFGNCLERQGFTFESPIILEGLEGQSFYDQKGRFCLEPSYFKLVFKGVPIECLFSEEDYKLARVAKDSLSPDPAKLLRLLAEHRKESIYEENINILNLVGRKNSGLKQFLKLEEWHHPDLAEDELPSQSISMVSLAKALETNRPEAYSCPAEYINSLWYHWGDEYQGWR